MNTLVIPFGYPNYPQEGLLKRITDSIDYLEEIGLKFTATEPIINYADCDKAIQTAVSADYGYCIILIASWIETPNVIKVISAGGIDRMPILLWSHDNIYDEKEDEYLSFGPIASSAVVRETFEELEYTFRFVVGNVHDSELTEEIMEFDRVAKAIKKLNNCRIGLIGYTSMGMHTGLGDHMKVKKLLGPEIVHLDQFTLVNRAEAIERSRIEKYKEKMKIDWDIAGDITEDDIDQTISFYLALGDLVKEHDLDGVTVKCQYELSIEYGCTPCVALSILGEEMPVSCEGDVYMLLTQIIMDYVTGENTTYGDILAFQGDSVISAACGFAPRCFLRSERPRIERHTSLYSGLLVTTGLSGDKDVTIGRIANYKDGFKMHIIEGRTEVLNNYREIDCPRYPGVRIHFSNKKVSDFKDEIMSQHYIMVFEHHYSTLKLFCDMKGIKII